MTKENISVIMPTEIETLHSSLLRTLDSSDLSVTGVVRTSYVLQLDPGPKDNAACKNRNVKSRFGFQ